MAEKTLAEKIKGLIHYNIIPQLQDILTSITSGFKTIKFTDLTDVPATYTGQGGKVVSVKSDGTGLEFTTPSGDGWSPQSLGQVLAVADRDIKIVSINDGDYTFLEEDASLLVVFWPGEGVDGANITVTIPSEGYGRNVEYKSLVANLDSLAKNNTVTYVFEGGEGNCFGQKTQNSDDNLIACIKLLESAKAFITYQSSTVDSALIYEGYLVSQTDTGAPVVSWLGNDGGITTAYVNEGFYSFNKAGLFDSAKVFFDTTPFEGSTTTAVFTLIPDYEGLAPDALLFRCTKLIDSTQHDNEINNVRFRITIKP